MYFNAEELAYAASAEAFTFAAGAREKQQQRRGRCERSAKLNDDQIAQVVIRVLAEQRREEEE